mgnify:FL=1
MGWKDWSYWLKGGIIGLVIAILFIILSLFIPTKCIGLTEDGQACTPPKGIESITFNLNSLLYALDKILLLILLLIVIGSIIGFIYGKIKSRKKSKK